MGDIVTVARAEALSMIGEHGHVLALLEPQRRLLTVATAPAPTATETGADDLAVR